MPATVYPLTERKLTPANSRKGNLRTLKKQGNRLLLLVARAGIEPATRGFSGSVKSITY